MKKRICICLSLLILLFAVSALAAPGDNMLFFREPNATESESIQAMAGNDKGLYVLKNPLGNYDVLELVFYDYSTGETATLLTDLPQPRYNTMEEFEEFGNGENASDIINTLFVSDNVLYALNFLTGEISQLTVENGAALRLVIGKLDPELVRIQEGDYSYLKEIRSAAIKDESLYLAVFSWSENENAANLIRFDIKTGSGEPVSKLSIMEMVPYKDGQMLAMVYDPYNSWDEATQKERPRELHTLDLATGDTKLIHTIAGNFAGIQYDAENDAIYFALGSKVTRLTSDSKSETVAYLPSANTYDSTGSAFANGLYSYCTWNGVTIRNTDPQYLPSRVLTIYGGWAGEKEAAFVKNHPDVAFNFSQDYISTLEQLATTISTDPQLDIVQSYSGGMSFDALIKKGYCADLSGYPELVALVESMYPHLKDYVMRDGKLYAIPLGGFVSGSSYVVDALKNVEMTTEDLPRTYEELCEFISEWNEETIYDFPNYLPIYYEDVRRNLFYDMFTQYCLYYEATGQELTFNTPLFKSLMTAFDKVRTDNIFHEGMSDEELWSRMPVIESGSQVVDLASLDPTNPEMNYYMHWPIALSEDTPVFYSAQGDLMFISPGSKNMDIAVEYMIYTLNNLSHYETFFIFANLEGNIESPYFEGMLKDWQKEIDRIKAEMEKADAADMKMYEDWLASYEDMLENKDRYRYDVTQAALDYFRENIADKTVISLGSPLWGDNSEELTPIVERFLAKEISSEQMILEIDKKIQMILRESR